MNADLIYPNYLDLTKRHDELIEPDYFNYFCLHVYQVFFRLNRRIYEVYSCTYVPKKFVRHDVMSSGQNRYFVYRGREYEVAFKFFCSLSRELLDSHISFSLTPVRPVCFDWS